MDLVDRRAEPGDTEACLDLRGRTRENAFSLQALRQLGITTSSWREGVRRGSLVGWVCRAADRPVGFSFGDPSTGEVLVVAVAPEFEGRGIGRTVLTGTVALLEAAGCGRLFLAASQDPQHRAHGFYRRLGWRPTGRFDRNGDEWLERPLAPR